MKKSEVQNRVDEALHSCLEEVPFLSVRFVRREPEEAAGRRHDMVARLEGPDGLVNFLIVAKGNGQPRFAEALPNSVGGSLRAGRTATACSLPQL